VFQKSFIFFNKKENDILVQWKILAWNIVKQYFWKGGRFALSEEAGIVICLKRTISAFMFLSKRSMKKVPRKVRYEQILKLSPR